MTLGELLEALKDCPHTAELSMTVYCPHGGNSLPTEIDRVVVGTRVFSDNTCDYKVLFQLSPADGVGYEAFEEEGEDNDI